MCCASFLKQEEAVMDNSMIIIIVVAIVAALAIIAAAWMFMQKKRTQQLQSRFGPEYQRVIDTDGDRRHAEAVLQERRKRVEKLDIRPLSTDDQRRFEQAWIREQARFVDDPKGAVAEADRLIGEAMRARGYPVGDFEQRAADISVDHPMVVENYRIAHAIAIRDRRSEAGTEDLRKAMVHYRSLFEELLDTRTAVATEGKR
jgi:hypothetical protein